MLTEEEKIRYSRQINISKIGIKGQEKLKNASVLVIGAGGLGSPILMYLVSAGIGRLGIADDDTVSLSNLSRQVLYDTTDIGKKKALVAKTKLEKMNPNTYITVYPQRISEENAPRIFPQYNAVVDATDNFESRYIINENAVKFNKPLFIGAVGKFTGQAMNVMPHKTACYNCVFPEKNRLQLKEMDQRIPVNGVFTPLVGTVGTLVANEVAKYFLGIGENLFGRLLIYDALNNDFSIISVQKDPHCKVCGKVK
jgi:molybdopterin/thiamine biosynthesis adenylyltransferase